MERLRLQEAEHHNIAQLMSKISDIAEHVAQNVNAANGIESRFNGFQGDFVDRLRSQLLGINRLHKYTVNELEQLRDITNKYCRTIEEIVLEFASMRREASQYPDLLDSYDYLRDPNLTFSLYSEDYTSGEEHESRARYEVALKDVYARLNKRAYELHTNAMIAGYEYAVELTKVFSSIREAGYVERFFNEVFEPFTSLKDWVERGFTFTAADPSEKLLIGQGFNVLSVVIGGFEAAEGQREVDVYYPELTDAQRVNRALTRGAVGGLTEVLDIGMDRVSIDPRAHVLQAGVMSLLPIVVDPYVDRELENMYRGSVHREIADGLRAEGAKDYLSPLVGTRSGWMWVDQQEIDNEAQERAGKYTESGEFAEGAP